MLALVCGAAAALVAGVHFGRELSLRDTPLRVSQGPHLYVRGRNYQPAWPAAEASRADDAQARGPGPAAADEPRAHAG